MPWFYNDHSGEAADESGIAALAYYAALHTGTGWHEYATQAQMNAAIAANHWPPATGSISTGVSNLGQSAVSGATGALTNGLLPENFLMRAGEVLIGLILLAVGLSVILKSTPVGDAAGAVVKNVPKVVPV